MSARHAQVTIAPDEAGSRLDLWLAGRFTYHSRSAWQRIIRGGDLTVNGHLKRPAYSTHTGDLINYIMPDIPEPPVEREFQVLYEDQTLVIVNKPGNLPCHPAGRYFKHTLWHLFLKRWPACHMINRLDRETSGIVVIALNPQAAAALQEQFTTHSVHKTYLALVEGTFPEHLQADGRLMTHPTSPVNKKQAYLDGPGEEGIQASTEFTRLATHGGLSLVRCQPRTGRYHQLRATLCSLGFPLVGDKLYGVDDRFYLAFIDDALIGDDVRRLRMNRQALHATGLELTHPETGSAIHAQAQLPPDFASCLLTNGFPGRYSRAPYPPPAEPTQSRNV